MAYLLIYFWLHWVFSVACGLSLVATSCGYSLVAVSGLLIAMASLVVERWLESTRAQKLGHTDLVTPWHVGSSQTRVRTCVPCIGRRILNHWTSREVPNVTFEGDKSLTPVSRVQPCRQHLLSTTHKTQERKTDNSIDAVDGPGLLQAGNLSKSSHVCLLVTHFANGDKRGSVRARLTWRSLSLAGAGNPGL